MINNSRLGLQNDQRLMSFILHYFIPVDVRINYNFVNTLSLTDLLTFICTALKS
jgi:hypothetical protein